MPLWYRLPCGNTLHCINFVEGDVLTAKVGEVAHPMTEEHLITAIFAVVGNKVLRADLTADDEPVATFALGGYKGTVEVYEYCNC